jgi:hypothetical protein
MGLGRRKAPGILFNRIRVSSNRGATGDGMQNKLEADRPDATADDLQWYARNPIDAPARSFATPLRRLPMPATPSR